jgi:hypothetical protein
MQIGLTVAIAVAAMGLAGAGLATLTRFDRETCIRRAPEFVLDRTQGEIGYELIDLWRGEAWATRDWTPEAFAAFSPPLPTWLQNDPRVSYAADTDVLRSPGCDNDGEFSYLTAFGREFLHVADVVGRVRSREMQPLLQEARVEKHHRVTFAAGDDVIVLEAPDGTGYVRLNRPLDWAETPMALPAGWSFENVTLDAPRDVDLIGPVRVLRMADGTSYQGPLGPEW